MLEDKERYYNKPKGRNSRRSGTYRIIEKTSIQTTTNKPEKIKNETYAQTKTTGTQWKTKKFKRGHAKRYKKPITERKDNKITNSVEEGTPPKKAERQKRCNKPKRP